MRSVAAVRVDQILSAVALLVVLAAAAAAVVGTGNVPVGVQIGHTAFLVCIVAGDVWRLHLPGASAQAPVAVATSLAWAVSPHLDSGLLGVDSRSGFVIVGSAAACALAGLIRERYWAEPFPWHEVFVRILVISFAVLIYRIIPFGGESLAAIVDSWQTHQWRGAVIMIAVSALALFFGVAIETLLQTVRDHAPAWAIFRQEASAGLRVCPASITTAAAIALAYGSVGAFAVPPFLLPLVFLQVALGRGAGIRQGRQETLYALSRLTEQGGLTTAGHASRVANWAMAVGRTLGMGERELADLHSAALLHDVGQVSLSEPIPGGSTMELAPLDQRRIAGSSAAILSRTHQLARLAPFVADQAMPYERDSEILETPVEARIIKVTNAFDDLLGEEITPTGTRRALERMRLTTGRQFDPVIFRALCDVLVREGYLCPNDRETLDLANLN